MIVVLDASAAVRVCRNAGEVPEFVKTLEEAHEVIAPQLAIAELTSALWKYLEFSDVDRQAAESGLRAALTLVDRFVPMEALAVEAFDVAALSGCSAYDSFYLVLARRNGAVLLTADKALRQKAKSMGIKTRSLPATSRKTKR